VNLPGVVVDLPTLTAKDEEDLVQWGLPNDIDFIAASFVRKGSDLDYIRQVTWLPHLHAAAGVANLLRVISTSGGEASPASVACISRAPCLKHRFAPPEMALEGTGRSANGWLVPLVSRHHRCFANLKLGGPKYVVCAGAGFQGPRHPHYFQGGEPGGHPEL